jgi:hypothetical protein
MNAPAEQFISEPIVVLSGPADGAAMARGEPGLPSIFTWRDQRFEIVEVLERWKESGACRHGSGERYLRKHWYKVRTDDQQIMTLYFERQARSKSQSKKRWWLYCRGRQ